MPTRVKSITGHQRHPLMSGWELCPAVPGAYEHPEALRRAPTAWLPARAPSTAAECLQAAELWSLEAPPRRFDSDDWWYRVTFPRPQHGPRERLVLGFDGLATLADVWLNGEPLFRSSNMFVAHECALDERIADTNELVICFRALDRALEAKRPRPKWRTPMVENQQLRWFRTTLLGRTPGWSPPAAAVGPWRPVWLETRAHVSLTDVSLRSGVHADDGWLEIECKVSAIGDTPIARVDLSVSGATQTHSIELRPRGADETPGADTYIGRLEIPRVALWWPHTHGEPELYAARLQVRLHGSSEAVVADLGRVGFRTVTLHTRNGEFALHINGVPIFCRGACWTPLDPVSLNAPGDMLRATLAQVRSAGMNMLRVGGMMVYESDDFLDLCDSNGILLWQDFMFANMSYPEEDSAFVESVTREARQQLARLNGRPALAVLCGNSEGEQQAAMWGALRDDWAPKLFHSVLAGLARESCPDVPYWPSSAHGGSFPHQGNHGTTSYYGVGAYMRPLEDARRAEIRFATECLAFANVPEERTLARLPGGSSIRTHQPAWKTRAPRDLGAGWDFDDVRDHYLTRLFGVDPLNLRYAEHERYLTLSRIVSGEVMARVFAEWRRERSTCHGGLIWFWRDLWCGAGWGVIDALGYPKAAYYYLRRVLQPVSVAVSDEGGNGLFVHIANERAVALDASLNVTLYHAGDVIVGAASRTLTIPARRSVELSAAEVFDDFRDLSYAYRFGAPAQDLVVASLRAGDGLLLSQAFHFVLGLSPTREPDVGLSAQASARSDSDFDLKISTRRFAQSVWIEADGFVADDAYFHLAPGADTTVRLRRVPHEPRRSLRGRVHALNALTAAKIEGSR